MKKNLLFLFFSICFFMELGAQTVTATVQYNGAQANGCCNVCGQDYWCINNTGGCGTSATCDTRSFFDPVPAGNIVTNLSINYYSAQCFGNSITATINGNGYPTVYEGSTNCPCSSNPCGTSTPPSTGTFPCGITNSGFNYNYGANNTIQLCTGLDVCVDRVEIIIAYAPAAQAVPASQPGAITGNASPCTGIAATYSATSSNASSYNWTVPSGWTINSGQGTNTVTATPSATSGNICVTASNACGTSSPTCYNVIPGSNSTAPASATASPATVCSGSTTLSVSGGFLGGGAAWTWYSVSCGNTNVGTGSSLTVSPSTTTTYFVRAEGGCNTTTCASVTVTVNSPSTDPSGAAASSNPICGGSTTLSVSGGSLGTGANWNWFSASCGGPSVGSGSSVSVSPSSTTTYFVQAQGTCNTTACASVTVTVSQVATANAGSDGSICGSGTYNLAGAIGGSASGLTWSTSGTGIFNNTSLSNATYTPSGGDASGGSITLTLTTDDPSGPCPSVSDNMVLSIEQAATANAGADNAICAGDPFTLSGSIGGSATILSWSSSGSGTFDNAALANATYTPSPTDISNGTVTLTLTTNDPAGSCIAATDNLILTISTSATANAGSDNSVCAGSSFSLSGSFTGSASSSTWTSTGTGTFDNAALTNAIYTPSSGDISTGTVTLTITTNDPPGSCVAATDNLILTIDQAATANAGSNASVCNGNTFTLSGSIGGSATALNWTTSGTGFFDNAALPNATYTPSGTDISTGTVNLFLTTNDPPNSCNSAADTVVLTIDQLDNAGFSYSPASFCQSASNPTPTISGLAGGTFSGVAGITVNSASGEIDMSTSTVGGPYTVTYLTNGTCPNSGTFDVFITSSPDATFSYSVTQNCQSGANPFPIIIPPASAGTFSASPAGLIFVNTNTGEIDVTASAPGTYIVTNDIAAVSGCPNTSSTTTIQIVSSDTATISYSSSSYCKAASNPTPLVSGTPGGIFSESSGNIIINPSTGEIDIAASPIGGPYSIKYTTGGICPDSLTVQVSIIDNDDASFIYAAPSYCQAEPDPIPSITGTAGGSFSSSAGLVFISNSTGQIDLSASAIGTYVIDYNTGGSCADSSTFSLTINANDDATINPAGPYCQSDSPINMTSLQSGGQWYGTGITNPATGTFNPAVAGAGTHAISYSISGICGDSTSIQVVVNADADATINSVNAMCTDTVTFNLTSIQSGGTWSGTGITDNTNGTFNPAVAGSGIHTITYIIPGMCGDTDTVNITVNQAADATINPAGPFCAVDPAQPLVAIQSGGTWGGIGITNPVSGIFDPSLVNNSTTITYTIGGLCPDSGTTTITVNPKLDATITSDSLLCDYYTSDTLTASNSTPTDIWKIELSFLNPGLPVFDPGSLLPDTYLVTHIIQNQGNCGDTAYSNLIIINTPEADLLGPNSFCNNSPVITLNAVEPTPEDNWSGPGIIDMLTGLFDPADPGINPPQTVSIIHLNADPSGKCTSADTMEIFVGKIAPLPLTVSDTVCVDGDLTLFAQGVNDSLNWYMDSSGFKVPVLFNDSVFEPQPPLIDTSLADSVYTFFVQQQNGICPSDYAPVTLTVVNIGASFLTTPPDSGEIPLRLIFNNTSFGADSMKDNYLWTFGDGDSSVLFNPFHTYQDTGIFTINLTITDQFGVCKADTTYSFYAKGTSLAVPPDIFTPNGDGVNDVFNLIHKNLSIGEGVIYSRWGEIIFRWNSVESGWDGTTLSGTPAPDGVYYYIIKATGKDRPDPNTKTYEFKGHVTLVR